MVCYSLGRSAHLNRGTAIALYAAAVAIFLSGAIAAPKAVDPEFIAVVMALSASMASMSPFMLKAGEIMNRRREIYASWLINNEKTTLKDERTHKPQDWVLDCPETR